MRFPRLYMAVLTLLVSVWIVLGNAQAAGLGGDFSLTDQEGQPFQLSQLKGKVVLLFFGYTYCPDICPTELANLSAVFNALGEQEGDVQGVFVSLDPERDTPSVLKSYTQFFNKRIVGLTGPSIEIARVAEQYGVKYEKHMTSGGQYSLDHSANLYVIDQAGQLATIIPYGLPADHVLEVVLGLLQHGPSGS